MPGPLLVLLLASLLVGCGDDDRSGDAGTGGGGHGEGGVDGGDDAGVSECIPMGRECTSPGGDECCEGYVCRATSDRAFCVAPADTCFVGAEEGCCLDDADCPDSERCVAAECRPGGDGVCKGTVSGGECWADSDCPAGETCGGVVLCPCGEDCFAPDAPGTCG